MVTKVKLHHENMRPPVFRENRGIQILLFGIKQLYNSLRLD